MAKVFLDGQTVCEIDWDRERFNGSAIHAVGKCLFHSIDLFGGANALNYAVALAAIIGYPDHEAWPIGEAFGDLELRPRSES